MKVNGKHIFVDVDNTLLVARPLGSFSFYDFLSPDHYRLSLPERISAEKISSEKLEQKIEDSTRENPIQEWQGSLIEYEAYIRKKSNESLVRANGWHPFWMEDGDSYALFPRPGAREFLEEIKTLGNMWICSTATEDYLKYVLGDSMGVLDMFEGMIHRSTLYNSNSDSGQEWEWQGSPQFVLIDDLPPYSDAVMNKLLHLGLQIPGRKLSGWSSSSEADSLIDSHLVQVPSLYDVDPLDDKLSSSLSEIKKKVSALGDRNA